MAHRFVSALHAVGRYVISVLVLLAPPLVSAADGGSFADASGHPG